MHDFDADEHWRVGARIRRVNDLGFDVEEFSVKRDGGHVMMTPVIVEEGHHVRELRHRTGLDVQENQARPPEISYLLLERRFQMATVSDRRVSNREALDDLIATQPLDHAVERHLGSADGGIAE